MATRILQRGLYKSRGSGRCKRAHFPLRSLMRPTHRWRVDIFVDIGSNNRLGRLAVFQIAYDIPDGPPDCEPQMGTPSRRIAFHRWCKSDSLICAAIKVVLMRTYCKRCQRSMFTMHDGRVIVQRGGARSGSRRWKCWCRTMSIWIRGQGLSRGRLRSAFRVEGQISRQAINY